MSRIARSLLFVPGSRPDRFDKAMAAGADAVVIDLEDAVAPDAKEEARAHPLVRAALAHFPGAEIVHVRDTRAEEVAMPLAASGEVVPASHDDLASEEFEHEDYMASDE